MRFLYYLLFATFISSTLLISSCSDDNDDEDPPVTPFMTANVGGSSWSASSSLVATTGGNNLIITGKGSDNTEMLLTIVGYNGTGTYQLMPSEETLGRWTDDGTVYSTFLGGSGSIVISFDDGNQIRGTFSFTATGQSGTIEVTSGEFAVNPA